MNLLELEEISKKYFDDKKYCCTESVLKSLLEFFAVEHTEDDITRFAAFGGGIGGCGCVCGTIVGATAAIGYLYTNEKNDKKIIARELSAKLYNNFKKSNKVTCCKILTKDVKDDKKAKHAYCNILKHEVMLDAIEIIEAYKTTGILPEVENTVKKV